ncbi:hypothetical protein D3C71_1871050 [compost metagenome]
MPGGIDRRDQGRGIGTAAADGRPGAIERLRLAEVAEALGLLDAIAIEQHRHPPSVVGNGQQAGKLRQDLCLHILVEPLFEPERAQPR